MTPCASVLSAYGYNKIVVESPLLDSDGNKVMKKGKPVPDTSKRDTESVPLDEDMDAYFAREVLPFNPDAWIDQNKTKIGEKQMQTGLEVLMIISVIFVIISAIIITCIVLLYIICCILYWHQLHICS